MKKSTFLLLLLTLSLSLYCSESPLNKNSIPAITADDFFYHIKYLAADDLQGRYPATKGDTLAFEYISAEFKRFGLKPLEPDNSYLQKFEFTGGIALDDGNSLKIGDNEFSVNKDYIPVSTSSNAEFEGPLVFAGYGIATSDGKYDDYKNIDAKGAVVLVLRELPPQTDGGSDLSKYESPIRKSQIAREKGAAAIIFITPPSDEGKDPLLHLKYNQTSGNSGIPAIYISRSAFSKVIPLMALNKLEKETNNAKTGYGKAFDGISAKGKTALKLVKKTTFNVVGLLESANPDKIAGEHIILGAHYDHLGLGGANSRTPDREGEIHNGADDNASGVSGILELAQYFSSKKSELKRDMLFIAFGAEELGVLGSTYYANHPLIDLKQADAMFNFDMIGRLRNNNLTLIGVGTSPIWKKLAEKYDVDSTFTLNYDEGGFGGSDHSSFYKKDLPVLFFFTDAHEDYHTPDDDYDKINSAGGAKILRFAEHIIDDVQKRDTRPEFVKVKEEENTRRPAFKVTLGVVPSFGGNVKGFKISSTRPGGPADKAGLKGGDIIIGLGGKEIMNINEYMYALAELKPGQVVDVVVNRDGKKIVFKVDLK